jgi:hypothetical protein
MEFTIDSFAREIQPIMAQAYGADVDAAKIDELIEYVRVLSSPGCSWGVLDILTIGGKIWAEFGGLDKASEVTSVLCEVFPSIPVDRYQDVEYED